MQDKSAERKAAHLNFIKRHIESNRILQRCALHGSVDSLRVPRDVCTICTKTTNTGKLISCYLESFSISYAWSGYRLTQGGTQTRSARFGLPYTFCNGCLGCVEHAIHASNYWRYRVDRELEDCISIYSLAKIVKDYLYTAIPSCPFCLI